MEDDHYYENDSETGEEEEYFDARQFIDEGDDDDAFTAGMPSSTSKKAQEKPDFQERDKTLKRVEAELYSENYGEKEDEEDEVEDEDSHSIVEDDTFDNTGDEYDDNVSTEEWPLERLEVFKASEKPQEYKDTKNLYDIFESPAAAKLPTGKSKGRFGGCQANRSGDQSGGQSEDGERFRGTEQKNLRGKRQRRNFGNEKELKGEHDLRTCSLENNKVEQRVGYQPNRGRSSRRARGGPTGSLRCGSVQGQSRHRGFRDGDVRMPVPLMPPDLGFGDEDTLHPQGGHGNRGDRGHQPKPKSKDSVRGYRGRVQGGYSQRQGEYQTNGGFQEGDQLSYEQSHFTQRQHYTERGRGQLHQGRRESLGRDATSLFLSDLASGNTGGCRVCDNSDLGRLGGFDSNRLEQANRGRPRDSCNRGRGQRGMRHAQSLSSVVGRDQSSGTGENTEERYGMERRKLRIRGLSESTTDDALTNFIEAISGEEVKEVQRLRNGNAIVTMVNDITNFSKIKTKGEKRGLDSAMVSIEQVLVCTSILVSGLSDNTTYDAIVLYFESRRNGGGLVKEVRFVPGSGRAVVVFEDPRDMERVLARQEETPLVLNKAQLSIRIYHEFLEGEDGDVPDDSGELETSAVGADKTQVSQQPEDKTQQLHIAVDPDVMEFVTSTAFHVQLRNALATKKSEIIWNPNNKMAVILYREGEGNDSWQSECIDEVQNYLGKFAKCDVQVNKDFWKAVVAQLSSVRACLGVDPPLVKTIDDYFVARIVSLSTDVKDYEKKLKVKLEDIYREETRKAFKKKKVPNVPKGRLMLLKKIKFVEKLQEKNKELEIKLDIEGEEIYFDGPQPQFTEATMKFTKLVSDMVEKKLTLSDSILEVIGSDKGLQKVKRELERNNVEAVFVIDKDARIIGTSGEDVDNAVRHVNKLILAGKVPVDDKSKHLLKTSEWRQLCDEINTETDVRVQRNNWNDTYVAGFRDDVVEVMKKLNTFLETNCIREERFICPSEIVRRYLVELRQEDLRSIENQLKDFEVKINKGKGDADFDISGNGEGLTCVKKKLDALVRTTESKTFDVKQPGLRKYFESEKGDRLVKSVEKDQNCAIQVQNNFGQRRDESRILAAAEDSDASGSDEDVHDVSDDDEDEEEAAVSGGNESVLVMTQGQKISWRPGTIETEKADALVCSQGASYQSLINAGVPAVANPNVGDITVSPGLPLANHVILTNCCQWHGGKGEATLRAIVQKCLQKSEELGVRSIAFPVIGAGKLSFPPDAASRIMLEETTSFCQAHAGSNVQDIRFVVYQQDHALTAAFKQEMDKLQDKQKSHPLVGRFLRSIRPTFRPRTAVSTGRVNYEVLQGDLCKETTDAIVNINRKDMNMDSAGALSKAVKQASGPQVEAECNQLGQQSGGTAVITSGGNLSARHIIHLIPDSAQKDHLQQCVERCLHLAETRGVQSISIPAVGTGAFGLSAVDSASLIFKALANFSGSFNNVRNVRIVVFQPQMLQTFQLEHQKQLSPSSQGVSSPVAGKGFPFNVEVINGDLTQESTDAIMNINSTDMNMNNAGELSKAIANRSGPQVQQECNLLGKQTAGSAVMTSGGSLNVRHIIHIIPGSSDKQHLQQCLEEGLRLADTNNFQSISIPSVGTGGYGLAAADSAQLTFQALRNFSSSCKSVCKVRVVVFQAGMLQDFLQEQKRQPMQGVHVDEEESEGSSSDEADDRAPRRPQRATHEHFVKIVIIGKTKATVEKAVESLKKGFSEACTTEKVEHEVISHLSQKQINSLRRKAEDCDVKLEVETVVNRIAVRGQPTEVSSMVGEIWREISERNEKKQEEEQALLVSKNIEWSYEIHGNKMFFRPKTNAKIEMAHSKDEPRVQVSLRADQFVIDLTTKTGHGQKNGEQITLSRKVKGAEEGIALPQHWTPMPRPDMTVHMVTLSPTSSEYQDIVRKFQATTGGINIQRIERIQNPHLYKSYMVRKQKMDEDTGGNSERQLFHGTDAKNIGHINTQGFNRSFCGAHGTAFGRGVYFARDAQYSVGYAAGGAGGRSMYLARVLVGQYCIGKPTMIVPPPKNPSKPEILYDSVVNQIGSPSIFVVFFDNQCYPEYLITF